MYNSINHHFLAASMSELHIHGNVENSIIVQGDQNTLNLGAPTLSAARQKELTERYLRSLAEAWQFLTVSVHGEDRRLPLERVFFMLQARERPEAKLTGPPNPDLDPAKSRLQDAGAPPRATPPPPPVPLETVLGKGENLVLLGEPGAGKSTALQFIGLCFARAADNWHVERLKVNRACIPIRLNLQTSAASIAASEALIDVLRAEVRDRLQCLPEEARSLLEAWKVSPGLLVLPDGLDEVPTDLRPKVRERIQNFVHSGAAWVILTSRPAGFQSLGGLNEYTLKPFENPETEALPYLRGWLAVLKPDWAEQAAEKAQALLEKMQERPALRRLLDNPLLLRLSAQHYALSGEITRDRADLYRLWVEEAWQRATARGAQEPEKPRFLQALEALAWHLHTGGGNEAADLYKALQRFGLVQGEIAAEELLRRLREQTGLLARLPQAEDGKVRNRYLFSHQTLREYFVARRLQTAWEQDARRTWRFIKPRLHLPEWREPLALLVGSLPEKEVLLLLNKIHHAHSPEERRLRRDLFLVTELVLDSGHWEIIRDQLLPTLIHHALEDKSWEGRRLAIDLMGQTGDSKTVPFLLQRLYDKSCVWPVRAAAAKALGQIGNLQAVPALLQTLQNSDESEGVRQAAEQALLKIGDPQACSGLLQALHSDRRGSIIVAIRHMGAQAIPILLQALQDKNLVWMRREIIRSLGEIGDPRAVPALLQMLQDESKQINEKDEVVAALVKIDDPQAVPALLQLLRKERISQKEHNWWSDETKKTLGRIRKPQSISAVLKVLQDEDANLRMAAAEVLGEIGSLQVIPALAQALLHDENAGVRKAAAKALGKIGDTRAVPDLLQALRNEEGDARAIAAKALGLIGDPQAVFALAQVLLHDENTGVRKAAADALGNIGDSQATPALVKALQDEDASLRMTVAAALAKIGDPQAMPVLIQALQDDVEEIRVAAAYVLGVSGISQAVSAMFQALQDKSKSVRAAAMFGWGCISDHHSLPALIYAIREDEDEFVANMAIWALGKLLNDQPPLPHHIHDLVDKYKTEAPSKITISERREKSDINQNVAALLKTLQDENNDKRLAAIIVLGQIGCSEAAPALIQMLKENNNWVQGTAAIALGVIGDPQAFPALIQALQDKDESVVGSAIWALGQTGNYLAVPHLIQVLQNENFVIRWIAAKALGQIGDPRSISALRDLLHHDKNKWVKSVAAKALGEIGGLYVAYPLIEALASGIYSQNPVKELLFQRMEAKVIIPAALQALQDKNDGVRVLAMELLAYKGRDDDRTVPALIKMLRDESSFVRENAVIELKHIGDPRAMPALVQALRDEDKWVRAEAVKAVGKYGSLKDATDLIPALLDKSWDVREQAEKSLLDILSRLQLPDDFQERRIIISF
jgi:HEAT repeat protein